MEVITNAAREASASPFGERGAVIQRAANVLGLSVQRTHTLVSKAARQLGLAPQRKRRADAGESAITNDELEAIAGTILHDRRAGKWMIPLQETIDMLHAAGRITTRLSASHIARLLRQRGLDGRSLAAPTPHVRMRTEHINAVWQIDASVCVLYRAPSGELLLLDVDGVHYKNKPDNLVQVIDKLLVRFVAVEHASGAKAVRFYTGGETTENALDFFMWAMTQRHDAKGTPMPLHGVPKMLYTDQGGCFKSGPFRNFCSAMEIRQDWHKPRNSRATGSAENTQNVFERGFESRLRFIDRAQITVATLNALAELWMHAYNGTHKHSRHDMTLYAAWSTIGPEHLRVAPSMEIMRELPMSLAKTRTVTGDMRVSFAIKGQRSREYDVRYVSGVSVGDKVLVAVNPFAAPAVRVGVTDRDTGEIVWHEVQPIAKGWMGYDADAPVLEKGEYRAMPATPADERRARIAAQAFAKDGRPATPTQVEAAIKSGATPYQGQFDPFADLKAKAASLPHFLQRPGMPHEVAATSVEPERISIAAACQLMRQELGGDYDTGTYAWLSERYSEGVPRDVVQRLIEARRQALQASAAPGSHGGGQPVGLRVVGSDL